MEIEWEDPPVTRANGPAHTKFWNDEFFEQLATNPGQWAVYRRDNRANLGEWHKNRYPNLEWRSVRNLEDPSTTTLYVRIKA